VGSKNACHSSEKVPFAALEGKLRTTEESLVILSLRFFASLRMTKTWIPQVLFREMTTFEKPYSIIDIDLRFNPAKK
jgi:hypothetical protein